MRRAFLLFLAVVGSLAAWLLVVRWHRQPSPMVTSRLDSGAGAGKLKLGQDSRTAVPARPAPGHAIVAGTAARTLRVSLGVKAKEEAKARFRFVVELESNGGTMQMLDETVGSDSGWVDRMLPLPPGEGADRTLRLHAEPAGAAAPSARPYWGAVMVVGDADSEVMRRNVILISLDTLSARHLGAFGNDARVSPNIDALLGASFSFRRAYAQYPNTMVSHASLFTGLHPLHHGVYSGGRRQFQRLETLASVLGRIGYVTAAFTEDAWVASDFGFDRGFDYYHDNARGYISDARRTFAKARAWLQKHGTASPVFLFVHTYQVHIPYRARDASARDLLNILQPGYEGPFVDFYGGVQEQGPHNAGMRRLSAEDVERVRGLYASEIHYLDRAMGSFLEFLHGHFAPEEVLIVLTSDHGEEFDEHGKLGHGDSIFNAALHVPLAFHWPGVIEPGESRAVTELVDVAPTVLDLLQAEIPPGLDGRSLAPVILGRVSALPARPAFAELRHAPGECLRRKLPRDCQLGFYAVQTDRFKLLTSERLAETKLFDLQRDADETRDVKDDFPEEVERLEALLKGYKEEAPRRGEDAALGVPNGVDAAAQERLRALGYLQDE